MDSFYYVTLYFGDDGLDKDHTEVFTLPAVYCEPKIICAFVIKAKAIFATCDKYGCKQFNPWPKGRHPQFYGDYFSMLKNNDLSYGKTL